jgi:ribA/ribD-fused uncharacterized protein
MKGEYKSQLMGATVDMTNKRIYFYGGIFSQWAACSFQDDEGVEYNCAEQAMMAAKAKLFGDLDSYNAIMDAKSPSTQKALGRGVKNYDNDVWDRYRLPLVREINYWKFSQNPAWREILFLTDGFSFVECSPVDQIWGIGLGEDDPLVRDPKNWKGLNLLGKAIFSAQHRIISELYSDKN